MHWKLHKSSSRYPWVSLIAISHPRDFSHLCLATKNSDLSSWMSPEFVTSLGPQMGPLMSDIPVCLVKARWSALLLRSDTITVLRSEATAKWRAVWFIGWLAILISTRNSISLQQCFVRPIKIEFINAVFPSLFLKLMSILASKSILNWEQMKGEPLRAGCKPLMFVVNGWTCAPGYLIPVTVINIGGWMVAYLD